MAKDENVPVEPTGSTSKAAWLELGWETGDLSKKELGCHRP